MAVFVTTVVAVVLMPLPILQGLEDCRSVVCLDSNFQRESRKSLGHFERHFAPTLISDFIVGDNQLGHFSSVCR